MAEQEKWHEWNFRLERTSRPERHEFGMAITKEEAERRIAKRLGMKKLPSEAVVSRRELEKLEPVPEETEIAEEPTPRKKEG